MVSRWRGTYMEHLMRTQRGFGIIEIVLCVAAFAAVSAAAYMAWEGFKSYIAAPYVADQIKADQAAIDTMKSERDAADERTRTAQANAKSVKDASDQQTEALKTAEALAATAQAAARVAGIKYAQEVAKNAARDAALRARAANTPAADRTCAEVLGITGSILRDSQRIVNGGVPQ